MKWRMLNSQRGCSHAAQSACGDTGLGRGKRGDRAPRLHRLRSAAAFNLIEVTMAVAIVGVGMLAIVGLIANGVDSSRQVSDDTLVANLADDMINWSRITPYTNQTVLPAGAKLTDHSTAGIVSNTSLDANGMLFIDPHTGIVNSNLWSGYRTTTAPIVTNGYYRFTRIPMTNPVSFYGNQDITRVMIIAEWPINPLTGVPMTNTTGQVLNRRYFVGQVSNR